MKSSTKYILAAVFLSILIAVIFLLIARHKVSYQMDELLTFGLANNAMSMDHDLGEPYNGEELFQSYMAVPEEHRFDYQLVWDNQADDVHPPLYYTIIHTLSSFFPGQYFMLLGLLPNIAFAIILFWQLNWMFGKVARKAVSMLLSGLYLFTMMFVNIVVFFRMYAMLTVMTTALFMLFVKYLPGKRKGKWFYAGLYSVVVCGMLTHYYFSIVCAAACLIYGLQLMMTKRWKDLLLFVFSGMAGVATSIVIFPPMLDHIFKGYRGEQAFAALTAGNLREDVTAVLGIIDRQLFGGLSLILGGIILVLWLLNTRKAEQEYCSISYLVLQFVVPVVMYIGVLAKVAPYKNERYLCNVSAILYFAVFAVLLILVKAYRNKGAVFAGVIGSVILVFSYQDKIPNLFQGYEGIFETLETYADVPCVYVRDDAWRVTPNYMELRRMKEITFLDSQDTLDLIDHPQNCNEDAMVVYICNEVVGTEFLDRIVENNPDIVGYTQLFHSGYSNVYLLE